MELLFITLGGALLGIAGRYLLPWRHTHGVILVPAIGVVAAAIIWEVLTWLGLNWNNGIIWWITILGTAAVVSAADLLLGRRRTSSDTARLEQLTKTGVPA